MADTDIADAALIETVRSEMGSLRGHLFGAVELMGMWPKQEEAFKGMIRGFTYDAQRHLEARLRRAGRRS